MERWDSPFPAFSGSINVDPSTGILRLTNAGIPGMYDITLFASGELPCDMGTSTFSLEVLSPVCSDGRFEEFVSLHPGENNSPNKPFQGVFSMVTGDFNNDGYTDLAGTRYYDASVIIYLGNETGIFTDSIIVPVKKDPVALNVADFNGDGNLDMLVSYGLVTSYLSVELGDGEGHFTQSYLLGTPNYVSELSVGDFNGDGIPDILLYGSLDVEGYGFKTLIGDGRGGIAKTSYSSLSFQAGFSVLGDLNNDGILDVVTNDKSFNAKKISVLLGDGTGSLQETLQLDVPDNPVSIKLADLNADGLLDIFVANSSRGDSWVRVFMANEDGSYLPSVDLGPYYLILKLEVADFTGDGIPDVLILSFGDEGIIVHKGNRDGSFSQAVSSVNPGQIGSFVTSDFNRDGLLDLALADTWINSIVIKKGIDDCGTNVGVNPLPADDERLDFVLYPNPANAFATLQWTGKEGISELSVAVYDLTGRKLLDYPNIKSFDGINSLKLDIRALIPGISIVKIEMNGASITKKLVKQ